MKQQDLTPWIALNAAFDPWKPVTGAQRADRGRWSPVSTLSRELANPLGRRRVLLLGTQGSGKTTELLRLAEERSDRFFVVYVDLGRHMQEQVGDAPALVHLQAWEVLYLVGLAVYRAGREQLGIEWSREATDTLADAITALQAGVGRASPTIDVAKLAGALLVVTSAVAVAAPVVAGASATGALAATLGVKAAALTGIVSGLKELVASGKWEVPIGRRDQRTLDAQDPALRRLRDAVNHLVDAVQTQHRPLLLVVDGLDRVVAPEGVARLFVDSSLLAEIECNLLVAASLTLRRPGVGAQVRGWDVSVMYNVPVLDHDQPADPARPGPGLQFFRDLVPRRHPEGAFRLPEPVVDQLAWASGGLLRMFLHLVQSSLIQAVGRDLEVVDPEAATAAIDDRRRQMEGVLLLTDSDLDLLARVAIRHRFPDGDRVNDLVNGFCILPYPNETEWWYPHPLLTLVKLRGRIGFGS